MIACWILTVSLRIHWEKYNFREFSQHGCVIPLISDESDYIIKKKNSRLATSQPKNWLLTCQFSTSVIFRILTVKSEMMDCGINSKQRLGDNFKIDNLFSKQRKGRKKCTFSLEFS